MVYFPDQVGGAVGALDFGGTVHAAEELTEITDGGQGGVNIYQSAQRISFLALSSTTYRIQWSFILSNTGSNSSVRVLIDDDEDNPVWEMTNISANVSGEDLPEASFVTRNFEPGTHSVDLQFGPGSTSSGQASVDEVRLLAHSVMSGA